ncbi:hypothetical protein BQ8769_48 [Escherichia coli]|uniref:Uncharacterized protein n=1 Tax=Escherichia coli TaxID=562 RepID=A0A1W1EM84_ECOLX|nr:hypothetical protein BQ8769_48 [Escherichia coli]
MISDNIRYCLIFMMKIISDMILCELLNYHIICPFPVVQIRFPAEVDPDLICC